VRFMRGLGIGGMLAAGVLLADSPRAQDRGTCDFDYVAEDGLAGSIEVTEMVENDSPTFAEIRKALPNAHRVFMLSDQHHIVILGWNHLPEDYSRWSKYQVESQMRQTIEYGGRTINQNAQTTYRIDLTPPLAAFVTLDYFDEGSQYRDVAMDVIATSFCIFSVKFSGPVEVGDGAVWDSFRNEFERLRVLIAAREGIVGFSDTGVRFSVVGLTSALSGLATAIGFGIVAFFGIGWRHQLAWGRAARRYSATIATLAALFIAVTILANESLRGIPTRLPYETIIVSSIVLATHLIALIKRTSGFVLTAVSLMIGTQSTTILSVVLGWMAFPSAGQCVGIVLSFALLIYVLRGSLRSKDKGSLEYRTASPSATP
jgi:hypothetical protein